MWTCWWLSPSWLKTRPFIYQFPVKITNWSVRHSHIMLSESKAWIQGFEQWVARLGVCIISNRSKLIILYSQPSSNPGCLPFLICNQTLFIDSDVRISCQWVKKKSISTCKPKIEDEMRLEGGKSTLRTSSKAAAKGEKASKAILFTVSDLMMC